MSNDNELARLKLALDRAIYSLEDIRKRAERGSTSNSRDWHCAHIAELAEEAIDAVATTYMRSGENVIRPVFGRHEQPGPGDQLANCRQHPR